LAIYTASYIPVDKCHTLSEFLSVGRSANIISYTKLSFLENNYVVKNILDDYMFELKRSAVDVKLSDEEYTKYRFRPKLLSYDVYDSTEFFYVILKLNNMYSIKQFDINPLKMLTKNGINNMVEFLSTIYNAERTNIQQYNTVHNS
jgi:hypothetical protein